MWGCCQDCPPGLANRGGLDPDRVGRYWPAPADLLIPADRVLTAAVMVGFMLGGCPLCQHRSPLDLQQ